MVEHKALEDGVLAMARALGAETYLIVIIGEGHIATTVSSDLKPYERGFLAEVEKARAHHIVICHPGAPGSLRRAEEALGKTKHTELHPIVAVLIESLNKMNGVRVSRSTALKDSSAIPRWWPHGPKKYAERMQQLTIKDLTVVIDSIFREVRGDVPRVEKLWAMLTSHFKTGSCSIATRAVFDAYFDFLLKEALEGGNGPLGGGNASLAGGFGALETGNGSPGLSASGDSSPSTGKEMFPLDLNVDVVPGQLQMSNTPGNALGNMFGSVTSGFQAVAPRNVHRPQPTRLHVPEFTKQELRVQTTADNVPRGANLGSHVDPVTRTFLSAGTHQAATAAEILARSLFTAQEYADSEQVRKRPRVEEDFVDLAWARGTESGPPMASSAAVSFLSNLVAPSHAQTAKSISDLLKKYDTPEEASHEEWRKLFQQSGVQSTAPNEPFARSTNQNGPGSYPTVAKAELPLFGPASYPASYPITEKGDSTADAPVEVVAETGPVNPQPVTESDPVWTSVSGKCRGWGGSNWRTENRRNHVDETEEPGSRPYQAAPANARLPAASPDGRLNPRLPAALVADARRPAASPEGRLDALLPAALVADALRPAASPEAGQLLEASDVLAGLVRSPSPSDTLTSPHVASSRARDDLAFVVGTLVRGLNRISSVSSEGLRTQNAVPEWFPFPLQYPNFTETLGKEDLLKLLDVVLRKVRGEYFHIRELRNQWTASKFDVGNTAMRAKIDVYFDALEAEAAALMPKSAGRRAVPNSPKDDPMGGADLQL